MFDDATRAAIDRIASGRGWEPAALLAVAEVESAGKAFAMVNGKPEPLIRFEGHYFDKRLSPAERKAARAAGLSSPKAGAIPNGSQAERWKLLNRAAALNANAAFESCSYGVGQVMGANWKDLGFNSVTELVNLCRRDVGGQVEVMARFIDKNGLAKALKAKDWGTFAKGYNGPAFKKNAYDTKMAAAYQRYAGAKLPKPAPKPKPAARPALLAEPAVAEYTDKTHVEVVQRKLLELKYQPGGVDGVAGRMTREALLAFRLDNGLPLKPTIDDALLTALDIAKPRELAHARENASEADVRAAVPEVKTNWLMKMGAWAVGVPAGIGALFDGVLGNIRSAVDYIRPLQEFASDIPGWVYLGAIVAIAGGIWLIAHHGVSKGVEAYQDGARR